MNVNANAQTDPRILKQMLLAQWTSGVNPLGTAASSQTDGGGGMFDMLLQQLLNGGDAANDVLREALPLQGMSTIGGVLPGLSWDGDLTADSGSSSAFDGLISSAAAKYGVSPALIKGVIQSESSFRPDAISSAGAKGLMQLMDDTARGLGVSDSLDPAQNVDGGTRFLSYLLRKYDGNVSVALAAYNAGPGRVNRLGIATDEDLAFRLGELPKETQSYVGKVLNASERWSAQV